MTYAIAAAGTGGHVFPGLAVGEALADLGVDRAEVLYIGGRRLEATTYPAAGFPFMQVELRGLQRRLSISNLALPGIVWRAVGSIRAELARREVRALLGMGGYVTVPAGLAARRAGASLAVAEQNATAGLANRMMGRWAERAFGSFPTTGGLPGAEWVGNPIRRHLADFDRGLLRPRALEAWELDPTRPVLGVVGGSLGAAAVNGAVEQMLQSWEGEPLGVLHLAGRGYDRAAAAARVSPHRWRVLDFCDQMDSFYAACDLVIARAGGSVAELTATATPGVLVPGGFGSGGHQRANAAYLASAGAAEVVAEDQLDRLPAVVAALLADPERRAEMARAGRRIARPQAATAIARAMIELGGP